MLKEKIILLLCLFCIRNCLARSTHPAHIRYDYRVQRHRQSTTPRPILQQYWQSFVNNLPTLPAISWNVTNPIGNLFNGHVEQVIETPEPNRRKTKTPKPKRKQLQSKNYYTTYDNGYQQIQLQPLGLDHNRIMHFYDPASGQYYALQVESQPNYYHSQYESPYNYNPYNNHYNEYNNYGGYYEDNNRAEGQDEYYYQNNPYNSNNNNAYDHQHYSENSEHNSELNDNESSQEEYDDDDDVELADNWGYDDDEIFADRKLKEASIAERIIKIQKHLLKPETEEDAKHSLSKQGIITHRNAITSTKKNMVKNDGELGRNAMETFTKKSAMKAKDTTRLEDKPRKLVGYYIFPTRFWL